MRQPEGISTAATIPHQSTGRYHSADLEQLFCEIFRADYHTVLCGGASEPLYRPASAPGELHRILYSHDYFRSALHEVAHWCVAGAARRQQPDYGYWYAPDGRNAEQQARFARVEVYPQALEALFCAACGYPFRVSLDNLDGEPGDEYDFAMQVRARAQGLLAAGLAERPQRWCDALVAFYGRAGQPLLTALEQTFIIPARPVSRA